MPMSVSDDYSCFVSKRIPLKNIVCKRWPIISGIIEQEVPAAFEAFEAEGRSPPGRSVVESASLERSNIYKATPSGFGDSMKVAYARNLITSEFMEIVSRHQLAVDAMICHENDRRLNYWALRSLRCTCLLRDGNLLLERPQHLWMRTALHLYQDDLRQVQATYELMAALKMLPSAFILAGSGTSKTLIRPARALRMDGSVKDIAEAVGSAALLARGGSHVGVGVQAVPSRGAVVKGIVQAGIPLLVKALDASLRALGHLVDTPLGGLTIYLEPWHADIESILRSLGIRGGPKVEGAKRIRADDKWTLFCPTLAAELDTLDGPAFEAKYAMLESAGNGCKKISALKLWNKILKAVIDTGGITMVFKDTVYGEGVMSGSPVLSLSFCSLQAKVRRSPAGACSATDDLRDKFVRFTHHQVTTQSTSISLVLPSFVAGNDETDFAGLEQASRQAVSALNALSVRTARPPTPLGIPDTDPDAISVGFVGFADLLSVLGHPYDSEAARVLNIAVSESVQHSAIERSCELASARGFSRGSPSVTADFIREYRWEKREPSDRFDWSALQSRAERYGIRNQLVTAYGSDAMTALIAGCSEAGEPYSSLVSVVSSPCGVFAGIPGHLVEAIDRTCEWNAGIRDRIVAQGGSVQQENSIPSSVRSAYRTVWDMDQDVVLRMAIDRAPFLCRGQNVQLYLRKPCVIELSKLLFQGWIGGLAIGLSALHRKPARRPFPIPLPSDEPAVVPPDAHRDGSSAEIITWLIISVIVGTLGSPPLDNHLPEASLDETLGLTVGWERDRRCFPSYRNPRVRKPHRESDHVTLRLIVLWLLGMVWTESWVVSLEPLQLGCAEGNTFKMLKLCPSPGAARTILLAFRKSPGFPPREKNVHYLIHGERKGAEEASLFRCRLGEPESSQSARSPSLLVASPTILSLLSFCRMKEAVGLAHAGNAFDAAKLDVDVRRSVYSFFGSPEHPSRSWLQLRAADGGRRPVSSILLAGSSSYLFLLLINLVQELTKGEAEGRPVSRTLARTAEGESSTLLATPIRMEAYQLARQMLAARDPTRWGSKSTGGHEDMRTSFVWLYLKLKYGEDDSRKTVAGRIFRITKVQSNTVPADTHIGCARQSSSLVDMELVKRLGLSYDVGAMKSAMGHEPASNSCYIRFTVCRSPNPGSYELHYMPPITSSPLERLTEPTLPSPPSLISLLYVALVGSPFEGGTIDLRAPWAFTCFCDLRLLDKTSGSALSECRVKLQGYGSRYNRVTRCAVPLSLVQEVQELDLQSKLSIKAEVSRTELITRTDTVIEQSLTLNLNSVFALSAINAVLPMVTPFTRMIFTYALERQFIPSRFPDVFSRSSTLGLAASAPDSQGTSARLTLRSLRDGTSTCTSPSSPPS
ncbi:ribonucleotide reductase [Ephemerocybe angulata]|uniref:Ribonucleoside-diphosphate reductase n=1 Tax=Ephemerocybe angulata TaxID=980116 RepID=A0A8H6LZJ4_9AGAR|nr:ribonucleotide reductase [Tulosesus angulatus]